MSAHRRAVSCVRRALHAGIPAEVQAAPGVLVSVPVHKAHWARLTVASYFADLASWHESAQTYGRQVNTEDGTGQLIVLSVLSLKKKKKEHATKKVKTWQHFVFVFTWLAVVTHTFRALCLPLPARAALYLINHKAKPRRQVF